MIRICAATIFFGVVIAAPAYAQQSNADVQDRYRACRTVADSNYLEEFRGDCDAVCIRQRHGTEETCLAQHMKWSTATCILPTVELDREERHLEQAKDRCLNEFKAGVTAPP